MYDGLWTVEFIAAPGLSGTGVVVLNDGRLLGGDAGYYYSGNYKISGDTFQGEISIVRFDANSISVFGDIDSYNLTFTGEIKRPNYFEALANIGGNSEMRILVKGIKRENI